VQVAEAVQIAAPKVPAGRRGEDEIKLAQAALQASRSGVCRDPQARMRRGGGAAELPAPSSIPCGFDACALCIMQVALVDLSSDSAPGGIFIC
jgi:hypothetical protein